MAFPRVGGPGVGLDLSQSNAYWSLQAGAKAAYGFNEVTLPAGETFKVPAGQWQITPGPLTQLQFLDPITGLWRSVAQQPNVPYLVGGDGWNWRLANLSGCVMGAYVTNVGSGYTSAPTITASAGSSSYQAVVGGAINSSPTITAGGSGYLYAPLLIVQAPPAGGVQATMTCTISAGAVNAITVTNQGAGYQTAPAVLVVNDPRDTVGSGAVITNALTGAGTVTAVLCTNPGTALTAVPSLTFSGGGGSSAAATAVMLFTATGFTVGAGGVAYGNAQPFLVLTGGGIVSGAAGAVVNPAVSTGLLVPRQANITGTSTAGGAVTATGAVVNDGGLFQAVPTGFVIAGGSALPTTVAQVTITVGGVSDTSLLIGV